MNRRWNESSYDGFTRVMFFIGGVAGLIVSYIFSVRGFGSQVPNMVWAARGIVIMFIALQMYVNRQTGQRNLALMVGGLVSYGYGIYTNIVGILLFAGLTVSGVIQLKQYWLLIIPVTVGIPLEIVPEALIVMALFPESRTIMSDALTGLFDILGRFRGNGRPRVNDMRNRNQPVIRPASTISRSVQSVPDAVRQQQSRPLYNEPTYHPVGEEEIE